MCGKEYIIEIVTSKNNILHLIPSSVSARPLGRGDNVVTIGIQCNYINVTKTLLALKRGHAFIHKVIYRDDKRREIIVHNFLNPANDSNSQNDPYMLDYTSLGGGLIFTSTGRTCIFIVKPFG